GSYEKTVGSSHSGAVFLSRRRRAPPRRPATRQPTDYGPTAPSAGARCAPNRGTATAERAAASRAGSKGARLSVHGVEARREQVQEGIHPPANRPQRLVGRNASLRRKIAEHRAWLKIASAHEVSSY